MSTSDTRHPETSEVPTAARAILLADPTGAHEASTAGRIRPRSHGRAALASAFDDGLMPDEVARILAGRRIVEAFPVRRGESPADYAARAVAEMFVAYLQ